MMLGNDMILDGREYVTISEAANMAEVSKGRIRQLVAGKRFSTRKIGKSNLIPVDEFKQWIGERKPGRPIDKLTIDKP